MFPLIEYEIDNGVAPKNKVCSIINAIIKEVPLCTAFQALVSCLWLLLIIKKPASKKHKDFKKPCIEKKTIAS